MAGSKIVTFGPSVAPRQGSAGRVMCFAASAHQVSQIAKIERISRDVKGFVKGFQRPRIARHILEIRDYLQHPEAVLPNSIVLAFRRDDVRLRRDGMVEIKISSGPPGWVVDGQQRLAAAIEIKGTFELLVSAIVCDDVHELNKQFILINNTRPLPKPLVYELLPGLRGLPYRLADRAEAAALTEALNYREGSSLRGQILQHTNPDGLIKDTLLQRVLMNSIQHGALRNGRVGCRSTDRRFELVSAYFGAVQDAFCDDWAGKTPKTSRLLHGAGLVAMGYVMDELQSRYGALTAREFRRGLRPLVGRTHWTSGVWIFGTERRKWNGLQNTSGDYRLLTHHLVNIIRRSRML